jgi:hypothetical protein
VQVKTLKKLKGIPNARAIVSSGETSLGARQVVLHIDALDAYAIPEAVASLRLSVAEAEDLAARIVAAARRHDNGAPPRSAARGERSIVAKRCCRRSCRCH